MINKIIIILIIGMLISFILIMDSGILTPHEYKSIKRVKNENTVFSDKKSKLFIKNKSLFFQYKNKGKILIEKNITYDKPPKVKYIYESSDYEYLLVYYSRIFCGGPGKYTPFYIVKCDKNNNIDIIFSKENIKIDYWIKNNDLVIAINNDIEVSLNIEKRINNLSEEKKEEFLKLENISVLNNTMVKLKKNEKNNKNQIIIKLWIEDTYLSLDIGSIYLILEIDNDEIKIINAFKENLDN